MINFLFYLLLGFMMGFILHAIKDGVLYIKRWAAVERFKRATKHYSYRLAIYQETAFMATLHIYRPSSDHLPAGAVELPISGYPSDKLYRISLQDLLAENPHISVKFYKMRGWVGGYRLYFYSNKRSLSHLHIY